MSASSWLTLLQAGQTGSAAWHRALTHCGSITALLAAERRILLGLGLEATTVERLKRPADDTIDAWKSWLEHPEHALVTIDAANYPAQLATVPDPPLALWIRGHKPDLLSAPMLAMVGSRNATPGGLDNATAFARELGAAGLTIVSGLAAGIDAASHTGALDTASGTVAVLGNGIDTVYPRQNIDLANRIAAQGLIVSEYPPGTPAQRHRFPARNRIIAALGLGVLVVEASTRSGSLITARLGGDCGREIFAIPGSIHNPQSRGCHQLIRQGAKLVESTADILLELALRLREFLDLDIETEPNAKSIPQPSQNSLKLLPPEYQTVLAAVGYDPTGIDQIVSRSTLTTAEVSSMLLLLEMEGHVDVQPGGRYLRKA